MPAANNRMCSHCSGFMPSAQTFCWTAPTTGRNYYFCSGCAAAVFIYCLQCEGVQRRGEHGTTLRTQQVTALRMTCRDIPAAHRSCEDYSRLTRWLERAENYRPMPVVHGSLQVFSRGFCSLCASSCRARCNGCDYDDYAPLYLLGVEAFRPEGYVCANCRRHNRSCARCQAAQVATQPWSIYHGEDTRQTCRKCRTKPRESTFKTIKSRRTIGYELEFLIKEQHPNPLLLFNHGTLKSDGSLYTQDGDNIPYDGNTIGIEMVSDVCRGDYLMEHIAYVLPHVKEHMGWMNKKCGLHVHLGVEDMDSLQRDNVVRWWRFFEPLLFSMVTASRRSNGFCRMGATAHQRYSALNVSAYDRHKTFEVRLHHGTLDVKELQGWCAMLLHFFDTFCAVNYTEVLDAGKLDNITNSHKSLRLLLQMCKMPFWLKKHVTQRIMQQNTDEWLVKNGFPKPKKLAKAPSTSAQPSGSTTNTFVATVHYQESMANIYRAVTTGVGLPGSITCVGNTINT